LGIYNLDVFLTVRYRKLINKIPTNAHMFYFTLTRLHVSAHEGHRQGFVFTEYQDFNGHQFKGSGGLNIHMGQGKTGFEQDAKLVFRGGRQTSNNDCHSEMNSDIFKNWFVHQFLYSLVEAVMDNAIYHSVQVNKTCNL
jgi:hypothetical protein